MLTSCDLKAVIDELVPKARAESWAVVNDHCIARVSLDGYYGTCWYDVLDVRRPALAQLDNPYAFRSFLKSLTKKRVDELQIQSLNYRRRRLQPGDKTFIQVGTRRVKRGQKGVVRSRGLHTAVIEVAGIEEVFALRSLRTTDG